MGSSRGLLAFLVAATLLLHFATCDTPNPKGNNSNIKASDSEAAFYLQILEPRYSEACNTQITTRWAYITNVTAENADASTAADTAFLEFQAGIQAQILANFSNWQEFNDTQVRREFKYLSIKGPATMPAQDVADMNRLQSNMEMSYATVAVCDYHNSSKCDLRLDPEIEEKLATVTDWDELAYYWTEWHDAMSNAVRPSNYTQFIQYQTEMAKANGFNDMSEMWLAGYDDESPEWTATGFKQQMLDIWEELRPYYNVLHAYVRMKLRRLPEYEDRITKYGYLPAHILGNMWAQDWAILDNKTKPFPDAPSLDATEAMIAANYTVLKMFQESDKFFTDLGLLPMSDTFWNRSMLERPDDGREVVCHASAEDMCLGRGSTDFRIKQCTKVTMDQLVTVHHEMGHIEYFMQYTDENFIFRDGANAGFHEAIGDALALAVVTPKHLQCELNLDLGLDIDCGENATNTYQPGEVTETDYNFLFITALQKFVFFPFAISMDSWRWEVFEGKLGELQYNTRWWELRQSNQGIEPPSPRPSNSFDPSAKYHVVANVPYLRYFVSHILQFQFYESMCIAAGEFDPANNASKPLYQCDFSGSAEAGTLLGNMMKLGFTRGWPTALEAITGNRNMSIVPLLNYFKPLFDLMTKDLEDNGEEPCFGPTCEELAKKYVSETLEKEVSALHTKSATAEWAYSTNLTNDAAKKEVERVNLEYSNYEKKQWKEYISQFKYDTFKDPGLKRQFKYLSDIGISALNESDVVEYNTITSEMKKIYGTGKICPFSEKECNITAHGLSLNPDLEDILARVDNYDEMAYVWKSWRDATGAKIRPLYYKYIDLQNKAAKANGYDNAGDYWLRKYESPNFRADLEELWQDVKPLYDELHAYVRFKLSKEFPDKVKPDEPIPAHVLGNQWSQSFENLYRFVVPFSNASSFDVTSVLKEKFTPDEKGVRAMFDVANDFFLSLGLPDMQVSYGEKALIVKPKDREVVCHASAWDFSDGKDFRIKMCTNVDQKDFVTIHHELGHINYYLNYKHQPLTFRTGANPGFHEAIGDVVALSVSTPKHMSTIGYLNFSESSKESTINYLTQIALEKIAFLPFGYLIDSYRWKVFDGSIPKDKLQYHWLKMRNEYQGIVPPVTRNEHDFDPGSKYHVPGGTPYIRYFVSFILQFQIHKSLCVEAGQYPQGPLHNCDIYRNAAAGAKFKKLMEPGFSQNWQELLHEVTGLNKLDASAIKEYFKPLTDFLIELRQKEGYTIGWNNTEFEKFYTPSS